MRNARTSQTQLAAYAEHSRQGTQRPRKNNHEFYISGNGFNGNHRVLWNFNWNLSPLCRVSSQTLKGSFLRESLIIWNYTDINTLLIAFKITKSNPYSTLAPFRQCKRPQNYDSHIRYWTSNKGCEEKCDFQSKQTKLGFSLTRNETYSYLFILLVGVHVDSNYFFVN